MKTLSIVCVSLLGMAFVSGAQAQSAAQDELRQAATGATFKVGDTEFRLAPSASVTPATKVADPSQTIVAGQYAVSVGAAAAAKRNKRSVGDVTPQAEERLGVAVSESGAPTVVTSSLNVYFDQIDTLRQAVRDSGGTLTYASEIGGKGVIEFGSVAEAIEAMQKLQGKAGVKEVSPQIVQLENMLL